MVKVYYAFSICLFLKCTQLYVVNEFCHNVNVLHHNVDSVLITNPGTHLYYVVLFFVYFYHVFSC